MKENKFIDKFQEKSTRELECIVLDNKSFVLEAREAAIDLLGDRDISDEAYGILKEKFDKDLIAEVKKKKVVEIQKRVRKGKQFLTENVNAPQMHSKRVVVVFCALFATIFGTVLLLYNMKQANSKQGYKLTLLFGILYTIITIVLANIVDFSRLGLFIKKSISSSL